MDEELLEVRQVIEDRLHDLEPGLTMMNTALLAREIHSIKGLATAYGLKVCAGLAHALESALARNANRLTVIAFLDRMQDSLDCIDRRDDPAYLEQLLGSVITSPAVHHDIFHSA